MEVNPQLSVFWNTAEVDLASLETADAREISAGCLQKQSHVCHPQTQLASLGASLTATLGLHAGHNVHDLLGRVFVPTHEEEALEELPIRYEEGGSSYRLRPACNGIWEICCGQGCDWRDCTRRRTQAHVTRRPRRSADALRVLVVTCISLMSPGHAAAEGQSPRLRCVRNDAAGEFDVVDRNLNGYGMGRRGAPHNLASCGLCADLAGRCAMLSLRGAVALFVCIRGEKALLKLLAEKLHTGRFLEWYRSRLVFLEVGQHFLFELCKQLVAILQRSDTRSLRARRLAHNECATRPCPEN